jgi:hypothetical protein
MDRALLVTIDIAQLRRDPRVHASLCRTNSESLHHVWVEPLFRHDHPGKSLRPADAA